MKHRHFTLVLLILVLGGCNSYIQRTVWQSISRIGQPIPPAPHYDHNTGASKHEAGCVVGRARDCAHSDLRQDIYY